MFIWALSSRNTVNILILISTRFIEDMYTLIEIEMILVRNRWMNYFLLHISFIELCNEKLIERLSSRINIMVHRRKPFQFVMVNVALWNTFLYIVKYLDSKWLQNIHLFSFQSITLKVFLNKIGVYSSPYYGNF